MLYILWLMYYNTPCYNWFLSQQCIINISHVIILLQYSLHWLDHIYWTSPNCLSFKVFFFNFYLFFFCSINNSLKEHLSCYYQGHFYVKKKLNYLKCRKMLWCWNTVTDKTKWSHVRLSLCASAASFVRVPEVTDMWQIPWKSWSLCKSDFYY